MKKTTLTILIMAILMATAILIFAATLTIDIPAADVPRVAEAYGAIAGLGRPANVNEVQEIVRRDIIANTKDYERRKNTYQYTPPPMEMQPTPSPTVAPTPGGAAFQAEAKAAPPVQTPTPTPKKKK